MMLHLVSDLLQEWGVQAPTEVHAITSRVQLIGTRDGKYVLKRRHDITSSERESALLAHLTNQGFPVQRRIGRCLQRDAEQYCLYAFVPGDAAVFNFDTDREQRVHAYGESIAKLHVAMRDFPSEPGFSRRDLLQTVYHQVVPVLQPSCSDERVAQAVSLLESVQSTVQEVRQLPHQLIHRDAHPGNMVFNHGVFAGFIDFEICEVNLRLFDPCYCLTSILNEGFESVAHRTQWVRFVTLLFRGYHRTNPLTEGELNHACHVMMFIQAIFIAYCRNDARLARKNAKMLVWIHQMRSDIRAAALACVERLDVRIESGVQ